jgi:hypothetical protein
MQLPTRLKVLIGVLILAGIAGLSIRLAYPSSPIPQAVSDLTLVLTLIALLIYVYYTYALAKEAWTISALFSLVPLENDPYHFFMLIQNYSNFLSIVGIS